MNKITDKVQSMKDSSVNNEQQAKSGQFKLWAGVFAALILLISVWWLLGTALDTKTKTDEQYQQQLKADAKKQLNTIVEQAQSALKKQTKKFKTMIKDDETLEMFSQPSQHEDLITKLKAAFDTSITMQIVSADYSADEIIDKPGMGYSVLFLLNELRKIKNEPSAQLLKIEIHQLKNKNSKLLLVRKVIKNNTTMGYIAADLSTDFFSSLTKDYKPQQGYLEIAQRYSSSLLVLMKKGDAALKSLPVRVSKKMNKTPWIFKFWTAEQKNEAPLLIFYQSLMYLVLALLAAAAAIVLLISSFRQYRKLNKIDISSTAHNSYDEREQESSFNGVQKTTSEENESVPARKKAASQTFVDKEKERLIETADTIFRAYDIRGEVGDHINTKTFYRIAQAIAEEMREQGQHKIAIACDGRISSPELLKSVINALLGSGIKVIDIGFVSSPILYFAALTKADGNGIMITAGHNPSNYNGMKIMLSGRSYSGADLQNLKKRFLQNKIIDNKTASADENKIELDVIEEYISKITADIKLSRPMKVVIDTANGITGKFSTTFFERLNCEVIKLNEEVDGHFPSHEPDPARPENMQDLVAKVIEVKADLGISFDGDGGRIGIISSAGEIIWPDRVLMLLARDILSRNKAATILFDVKSTSALVDYVNQLGGEALMCKSGHSFMKNKLMETGALLAGEMSGHIFIKERWFGFDDAVYSAARILEILSIDLRKSSQIFAELPNAVNTPEIPIETKHADAVINKIFQHLRSSKESFADGKIITIDGLRVEYSDGWGLVRSSNTSNNLTLRFEADNKDAIQRIAGYFKNALQTVAPELKLPF